MVITGCPSGRPICTGTGTTRTLVKALLLLNVDLQATAAGQQCQCAGGALNSYLQLRCWLLAAAELNDTSRPLQPRT
jgi:hypothetical protein